jgi:hypothetical protein
MSIPNLETAAVGRPINRRGISLFPVYLPITNLPGIATGPSSGITINELPAASVPHLVVTNSTDRPILLVEGESLVGGVGHYQVGYGGSREFVDGDAR